MFDFKFELKPMHILLAGAVAGAGALIFAQRKFRQVAKPLVEAASAQQQGEAPVAATAPTSATGAPPDARKFARVRCRTATELLASVDRGQHQQIMLYPGYAVNRSALRDHLVSLLARMRASGHTGLDGPGSYQTDHGEIDLAVTPDGFLLVKAIRNYVHTPVTAPATATSATVVTKDPDDAGGENNASGEAEYVDTEDEDEDYDPAGIFQDDDEDYEEDYEEDEDDES